MFGKKYLEIAALSGSLMAMSCGDSIDRDLGQVYDSDPGRTEGGSGGSEHLGQTAGSGLGSNESTGGMAGSSNVAGKGGNSPENCELVSNLAVSNAALDIANNAVQQISFTLAKASNVQITIKNSKGEQVKVLKPASLQPAGNALFNWNGTNSQGEKVQTGIYKAEVSSNKLDCIDLDSINFNVKNGIVECLLEVQAVGGVNSIVGEGSPSVEMACFRLVNGDCEMDVHGITLTNMGAGQAGNVLLNNRLTDKSYQALSGDQPNFLNERITFHQNLNLVMPPETSKTVCLTSDISPNSDGHNFHIGLTSQTDLQATPKIDKPTNIKGTFPVCGPEIQVSYNF